MLALHGNVGQYESMDIFAGLTAAGQAIDIAKGLRSVEKSYDTVELKMQIVDLIDKLVDVKGALQDARHEIENLRAEVAASKAWSDDLDNYELIDVYLGAMAYMPRLSAETATETPFFLCATCFGRKSKSFMQFKGQDITKTGGRGDFSTYGCETCKATIRVSYRTSPTSVRDKRLASIKLN